MKLEMKDYGFRRVVRVTINNSEPKWVHPDGSVPTQPHSGDTVEAAGLGIEACKLCVLNHKTEEFYWNAEELTVPLNKWGNPARDGQAPVGSRQKTWAEMLAEIEGGRPSSTGVKISGKLPPLPGGGDAIPLVSEEEPLFQAVPRGNPRMDGDTAVREFTVLKFGIPVGKFTVKGTTKEEFQAELEKQMNEARKAIEKAVAEERRAKQIAL